VTTLRVVTWNMNAVAPVASWADKWRYLQEVLRPDIALLTEARPREAGSLQMLFRRGGMGKNRSWGTVMAVRSDFEVAEIGGAIRELGWSIDRHFPGAVVAASTRVGRRTLGVVAAYAPVYDADGRKVNHGLDSTDTIVADLESTLTPRDWGWAIVGGDFNYFPPQVWRRVSRLPLVDLVASTSASRAPVTDCICSADKPCGHLWTHRNRSVPHRYQQIDFLFAGRRLAKRLYTLKGGIGDFPESMEFSDHAPIVAEFDV